MRTTLRAVVVPVLILVLSHATWAARASGPGREEAPSFGWLGVRIRDLSEQEMEEITVRHGLQEGYGVVLVEVLKDGPAETTGLRAGDLVVAYDGRPVVEVRALQRFVGATPAGRSVSVTVLRGGRRQTLQVAVGRMPAELIPERIAMEYGFAIRGASSEGPSRPRGEEVIVAVVGDRSPAKQGGLQAGDRIVRINGEAVTSLQTLQGSLQRHPLREPLLLEVQRQGERLILRLPPAVPHTPIW